MSVPDHYWGTPLTPEGVPVTWKEGDESKLVVEGHDETWYWGREVFESGFVTPWVRLKEDARVGLRYKESDDD